MTELQRIEELEKEIRKLKGLNKNGIPTYSFSKITESDLKSLVTIKKKINREKFDSWFDNGLAISKNTVDFFKELISENEALIFNYSEEDLKINVIAPILNTIKFKSFKNEFREFYEQSITYKTDKFIFTGSTDFLLSKGLFESEKPYFFIQEFKKGKINTDPEPQLLAELISAVELNDETVMKGAFIIGATWNFVILEKLEKDRYQYFVSRDFNCTNIEDLKSIYKNLLFIKNEIILKIELENKK
ncbi:MAG: hypothetical protein U9P38_03155 [Campylobacterota bacterium]|nr:hypothetical protein [Campylobacterota bacterium]